MLLNEENERKAEMLHYEQLDVDTTAKRNRNAELKPLELDISCFPESVRD